MTRAGERTLKERGMLMNRQKRNKAKVVNILGCIRVGDVTCYIVDTIEDRLHYYEYEIYEKGTVGCAMVGQCNDIHKKDGIFDLAKRVAVKRAMENKGMRSGLDMPVQSSGMEFGATQYIFSSILAGKF